MRLIKKDEQISTSQLEEMSKNMYGELVKCVVDVGKEIMVVDAAMHADQEKYLLDNGSDQQNLWGINLYPEFYGEDDFIEYDSMINLRPNQDNRTRGVDDEKIRIKIKDIVDILVKK